MDKKLINAYMHIIKEFVTPKNRWEMILKKQVGDGWTFYQRKMNGTAQLIGMLSPSEVPEEEEDGSKFFHVYYISDPDDIDEDAARKSLFNFAKETVNDPTDAETLDRFYKRLCDKAEKMRQKRRSRLGSY